MTTASVIRLSPDQLDELMLVRDGFCSAADLALSMPDGAVFVDLEGAVVASVVDGGLEFAAEDGRPFAQLYGISTSGLDRGARLAARTYSTTVETPTRWSSRDGALAESRDRDHDTLTRWSSRDGAPAESRDRDHTHRALWVDQPSDNVAELAPPNAILLVPMSPSHQPGHRALAALRSALAAASEREDLRVLAVPVELDAHPERRELVERALDADSSSTISDHEASSAAGVFILLTGLSGSGKSTIARALREELIIRGRSVTLLDGDQVRRELCAGLGFSPEDRDTNVRRIGWVGAEIAAHGGAVVACPIAPYDATRKAVRQMVEKAGARMVLVHVATALAECERRDRKGLYAKARAGELPDFTGISAPYEAPEDADLVIDTSEVAVADAVARIVTELDR